MRATFAAVILLPGAFDGFLRAVPASPVDATVTGIALAAGIWLAGDHIRRLAGTRRRPADATGRLRPDQLEQEERAVLEERVHIARELHDVVAHHLSVVALQAGLAKLRFHSDPDVAEKALKAVSETSSRAMEETRQLVTILRGPSPTRRPARAMPRRPAAGVDQLPILIERTALAGLTVSFKVEGTPRPLAPSVGLCVYRIVQESLTNIIKHAGSVSCDVVLTYRPASLTVVVVNETPAPGDTNRGRADADADAEGHGIAGMRERAELFGGSLSAGRLPGGGFEVRLALPLLVRSEKMIGAESVH